MKKLLTLVCALAAAGTMSAKAADLFFDFSSGQDGFTLSPLYGLGTPAGWSGGQALKMNFTSGGWQNNEVKEFSFSQGQADMQALANAGNSRISLDVIADGTSYPNNIGNWSVFILTGNSDAVNGGWTQHQIELVPGGWRNADDTSMVVLHIDQPFTYMGWGPGDPWFKMALGSNSNPGPANFYVDNIRLYAVPEPTILGLAGIGALALLLRRRS